MFINERRMRSVELHIIPTVHEKIVTQISRVNWSFGKMLIFFCKSNLPVVYGVGTILCFKKSADILKTVFGLRSARNFLFHEAVLPVRKR